MGGPGLLGRRPTAGAEEVDRRVGVMVAAMAVALLATALPTGLAGRPSADPVWTVVSAAYAAVVLVVAPVTWRAPALAARWLWALCPVVGLALTIAWVPSRAAGGPPVGWTWALEPAMVGLVTLVSPMPVALGYVVVGSLSVPLTVLLVDGSVPVGLAQQAWTHLGNAFFVMIVLALRRHLDGVAEVAARTADGERELVVAEAWAARRQDLAAVVHDEVLATLTAAARSSGPPGADLRRAAAQALALLDRPARADGALDVPGAPADEVPAGELPVGELLARLRAISDDVPVVVVADAGGSIPGAVVTVLEAAAREAVRNSLRHAGTRPGDAAVARRIDLEAHADAVAVTVRDDGAGFRLDEVPAARLGVRGSVLHRVRALPGGSARVVSAPGCGTVVELTWRRP